MINYLSLVLNTDPEMRLKMGGADQPGLGPRHEYPRVRRDSRSSENEMLRKQEAAAE